MKIETMEYLANKIENIELLKKLITKLDDMPKEEARKFIRELDEFSSKEATILVSELEKCDFNLNALKIIIDLEVKKTKTFEEKIKLIIALKDCDYVTGAYYVATNRDVLEQKTVEEQIMLMKAIKDCFFDEVATNRKVLEQRTTEEQIMLIDALKDCGKYPYGLGAIITNNDVLNERNVEDQIKLIKALKDCDYITGAFKVAFDKNILEERTVEEQIKLMKEAYIEELKEKMKKATVTHGENMKVISSIAEFKTYLNGLKLYLKKETDLNSDTEVLRYAPVDMWNKLVMSSDKKKEN